MLQKLLEDHIKLKTEQIRYKLNKKSFTNWKKTDKKHRTQKDKTTSFLKEQVENADLYKSVLKKMTTYK